jgi:hypothetical protein
VFSSLSRWSVPNLDRCDRWVNPARHYRVAPAPTRPALLSQPVPTRPKQLVYAFDLYWLVRGVGVPFI